MLRWVELGRGPTHVLIIGPRKCEAICSSAGSGASPPASVTVIKTGRPAVVRYISQPGPSHGAVRWHSRS